MRINTHAIRVKVLGTLGCDLSETKEASTGAADMSASRVEVGDGVPFGSEHDQCLTEIRRLEAEIERLLARDAPMMAENRRLTAENEVPLRERERQMMAEIRKLSAEKEELLRERERRRAAESMQEEGIAPGGPTDVSVDIPAVSAGFGDGGLETQHAENRAHDATDDEDYVELGILGSIRIY